MTVVTAYLENARSVTVSLLQKRVARCGPSLLSAHNLRNILMRRLGVGCNTAKLLVAHIGEHLISRGILKQWDSVGRGDIYRINVEKLREHESEEVVR